jgi:glyoxylase-like metal-dependent hydrolase (beta-lactamase superfamily II)
MRAISLHPDVIVVTSRLQQTNCTIVRGPLSAEGEAPPASEPRGETFVVDSPILPDELALLPSLIEQARFPPPRGLLATHADWDHLLARIAFPEAALGCAESSAARLQASPGAAQRALRAFDEKLYLLRERPLQLGAIQPLAVPGSCGIGEAELDLYPADGHTVDGMAVWITWAGVLIAGDYLSSLEIPTLAGRDMLDAYLATLERLRPLLGRAEHVVPGHGPVLDGQRALSVLEEDLAYLHALSERGARAALPDGRRSEAQRELHAANVAAL